MKNECKEKNWRECCKCNFFDECDNKKSNRIGIFTMFKENFENFLDKYKKTIELYKNWAKKKSLKSKIKKQTESSESAVDREFREIRLEEWRRYAEPSKHLYDYSKIVRIRPASKEENEICKRAISRDKKNDKIKRADKKEISLKYLREQIIKVQELRYNEENEKKI